MIHRYGWENRGGMREGGKERQTETEIEREKNEQSPGKREEPLHC